jgi:hypothetical protein
VCVCVTGRVSGGACVLGHRWYGPTEYGPYYRCATGCLHRIPAATLSPLTHLNAVGGVARLVLDDGRRLGVLLASRWQIGGGEGRTE